ncbi:MAG: type I restriction endonuclease [Hormoscilla sp.]
MVAEYITLRQLRHKFNLERTEDEQFFREWQDDLPELTDLEKQLLDEVKSDYRYLSESIMLEVIVKMVVLSPLLRLAGFYRPPFDITAEKEINISSFDEETIIKGRIDILIFKPEFWITVIETKRTQYSLEAAIPQALAYMLSNPQPSPVLGFVTNGGEYRFLKLLKESTPKYAQSDLFSIDSRNDLYTVLIVLKHMAQLVSQ